MAELQTKYEPYTPMPIHVIDVMAMVNLKETLLLLCPSTITVPASAQAVQGLQSLD